MQLYAHLLSKLISNLFGQVR